MICSLVLTGLGQAVLAVHRDSNVDSWCYAHSVQEIGHCAAHAEATTQSAMYAVVSLVGPSSALMLSPMSRMLSSICTYTTQECIAGSSHTGVVLIRRRINARKEEFVCAGQQV